MKTLIKKHITFSLSMVVTLLSFWDSPQSAHAKDTCQPKKTVIWVQPFSLNKKEAPTHSQAQVLQTLIKDYLNLLPNISATFTPTPQALVLKGSLTQTHKGPLMFKSVLEKSNNSLLNYEAPVEFPQNLNPLLIDYVIKTAGSLGEKVKEKQLLPFLNQTNSAEAYLFYADGVRAYHQHDFVGAQKAFETAIKNDYNYIPAYVLLSQVLRELMSPHAEVEWQKAQLLNPDLSKTIRERNFCP